MQTVITRSTSGSITINSTIFFTFNQGSQQFQIKKVWANLYQQGGHFCLDSSSSVEKKNKYSEQWFGESEDRGLLICFFRV